MASNNFSILKKQARYIDETISDLNSKLAYPESMFRPSKILYTENILEELMSENEEILQSINKEKEIAEHNLQGIGKFLTEINVDVQSIINEQKNIEEQLKEYGYTPMSETYTTLQEEEGDEDAMLDECNDVKSCEEQLQGISIEGDAAVQDTGNWNMTPRCTPPSEPLYSKYYYRALGLPVPAHILNTGANRTCI